MPFPISESEVLKTEKKLDLTFPKTFREAMMTKNGGEIQTDEDVWYVHPFLDTSDRKRISRTNNDIIKETDSARNWNGFPPDAFAIAANGCGDSLVLLPSKGDPNTLGETVFVFRHEESGVEVIAESFAKMLEASE